MKPVDRIVKYWPVAANVLLAGMCIEYFAGVNLLTAYTYPLLGYSIVAVALLYSLSLQRRFCSWHRALIANMCYAITLEAVQLYGVLFPDMFFFLSWSTAITFLYLCVCRIVKKRLI